MQGLNHTSGFRPREKPARALHRRAKFNAYLMHLIRAPLESVSLCTRFSGFSTISSFSFNRLSSKLVGVFFGIVPMFVLTNFVRDCFVAQICAKMCVRTEIRAYLRDEAIRNKILKHEHWNYPKEHTYQF